jgi:tRNA (guanine-N7-)-methyltransferase
MPEYLFSCQRQKPSKDETDEIRQILKDKHIFLELGSGSGQHLVAHAFANPSQQFVGMEIRYKRIVKTAQKAQKKNLNNLFLIRTDIEYIEEFFYPNQIKKIFINFPDPWDRRRWKKHRLTAPEYLDRYSRLLANDGSVYFKTDHKGLFDDTVDIVKARKDYNITFSSTDLHNSERAKTNIITEFEQLFKSKGMPIYALEFCLTVS